MNTEAIKNAIYAEMLESGCSLLVAKLRVLNYFTERLEVASDELKASLAVQ